MINLVHYYKKYYGNYEVHGDTVTLKCVREDHREKILERGYTIVFKSPEAGPSLERERYYRRMAGLARHAANMRRNDCRKNR